MKEEIHQAFPPMYEIIRQATSAAGFTMASDPLTGSLLRTLACSKPASHFLELGTGTGLSTAWILDGMDGLSTLISIDNDESFLQIARSNLGEDSRLKLVVADGGEWIEASGNLRFDFIFADTWHGKYLLTDQTLSMLNPGGLYVIDDMSPQPNWPEGHEQKVSQLLENLEQRKDLQITKMVWSTGIVIAVKK